MKRFYVILLLLFVLVFASAQAQDDCQGLSGNQACYGYGDIELFVDCENVPEFEKTGDIIDIEAICVMRLEEDSMATMMVQPEGYTDTIFFALTGSIEMQNAASSTFELEAVALETVPVYSGPGSHYDTIATLDADATMRANACNCTGNWLRIVMENNQTGWVPARRVEVSEDVAALPVVETGTPLFSNMQAFSLLTPPDSEAGGLLIQMMESMIPLQINGVTIELNSTAYIESSAEVMTITILDDSGRITYNDMTMDLPAGTLATIALLDEEAAIDIALYSSDDVAQIPLDLLPNTVEPLGAINVDIPTIIGAEQCAVVSDKGDTPCPIYFVNPDGDEIVQMDVEFIYAAQGDWTGSVHEDLSLLEGDMVAGTLAWDVSCSLGLENFIGPVEWLITLTDASGHMSQPFEASFNCVAGY